MYAHDYRDVNLLDEGNVIGNTARAFELIEREFGVSPTLSPDELAGKKPLDRLGMLSYLACLHEELIQENTPSAKSKFTLGVIPVVCAIPIPESMYSLCFRV